MVPPLAVGAEERDKCLAGERRFTRIVDLVSGPAVSERFFQESDENLLPEHLCFRRVSCSQLIKRANGQRSALTVPATATCAAAIIFALRLAIGAASLSCVHAGRDNRGRRLFLAGCAVLVHAPIIPQLGNSAPPIINHIRAAPHEEQQRGAAPLFLREKLRPDTGG